MNDQSDPHRSLSLRELAGSIMAAVLGVQSSRKHARDFSRGRAHQYVIGGLLATTLFVLAVFAVVKLILAYAAP